jgi:hypothetical protein
MLPNLGSGFWSASCSVEVFIQYFLLILSCLHLWMQLLSDCGCSSLPPYNFSVSKIRNKKQSHSYMVCFLGFIHKCKQLKMSKKHLMNTSMLQLADQKPDGKFGNI